MNSFCFVSWGSTSSTCLKSPPNTIIFPPKSSSELHKSLSWECKMIWNIYGWFLYHYTFYFHKYHNPNTTESFFCLSSQCSHESKCIVHSEYCCASLSCICHNKHTTMLEITSHKLIGIVSYDLKF